jgi:hypothetical protein
MTLPFRGFAPDRPYPQTGLSTVLWREVAPQLVRINNLWMTQSGVLIGALFGVRECPNCVAGFDCENGKYHSTDAYPHVVAHEGELYLEDGHTRVVREVLRFGTTEMFMRVYRRASK